MRRWKIVKTGGLDDAALKKILPSKRASLDDVLSDAEDNLVADGLRSKATDFRKDAEERE